MPQIRGRSRETDVFISGKFRLSQHEAGGAYRDRTDDLKLAKLALSQLSYGPVDREFIGARASLARTSFRKLALLANEN